MQPIPDDQRPGKFVGIEVGIVHVPYHDGKGREQGLVPMHLLGDIEDEFRARYRRVIS